MQLNGKHMITTAMFAGLTVVAAPAVMAQSRCGASYEIERGDTLYSISQDCRVALARIMDLNPRLDNPRDIDVGTQLQLVARSDGSDESPAPDQYEVREGDTLNDIARRFGVSIFELIAENGEFDPSELDVGEIIGIPGDQPDAMVSIMPKSGTPDSRVSLTARNLRPNDYVTIGAGPRAAEWKALREVQVDGDGTLDADVRLPDYADPGDHFIFVVDTDRGHTLKSDPFDVVDRTPDRLSLEGRVESGVECPELVTPDGDRYALAGTNPPITVGEYVEISGVRAPAYCTTGLTTVDIYDLREVAAPGEDGQDDGMRVEGHIRRGTECPMLVTADGDRYALAGGDAEGFEGQYAEVRGTRADMSICMEGRATINVERIIDATRPAPGDGQDGDGRTLTRGYLVGGWTAKGGDCTRPDFDITLTAGDSLRVETSLDGAPRTGFVQLGDAPAFVFDQPYRTLDLEGRRAGALAVMPPVEGGISLGGRNVSGDGRVFVNCG